MTVRVEAAGEPGDSWETAYPKAYEVKKRAQAQGRNTGYQGDYGIRRMFDSDGRPVVVHGPRNEVWDENIMAKKGLVAGPSGGGTSRVVDVPANVNTVLGTETSSEERVSGRDRVWFLPNEQEDEMISR